MRLGHLATISLCWIAAAGTTLAAGEQTPATPIQQTLSGPEDRITLDFRGVELEHVVRLMAEMTRKNYVLDPHARGKVTVITPAPVSVGEAEQIFASILSVHELSVVERDGAFKIVPLKSSVAEGGRPVPPGERVPGREEVVLSRLTRLRHVDAASLAATLKPLLHPWGSLAVHAPTNALVVTDAMVTTDKVMTLIEALDVPIGPVERRLFSLRHANVAAVEKLANAVFADTNSRRRKEDVGVKLFGDPRTNILVAVSAPEQMPEVETLILGLDHPTATTSGNLHLYYPKNSEADNIAKALSSLLGTTSADKAGGDELKSLEFARSVKVVSEKSTNTLVVSATPEDYQTLLPIIQGLDMRRLQIHVEALIIEISADRAAGFGVEWRFGGGTTGSNALTGFGGTALGNTVTNPLELGSGMTVGVVHGNIQWGNSVVPNIPALIRAFQSEADINILSTPNIVTTDGVESEIVVGQNIPIVSGTTQSTIATATATPGVIAQAVERRDVGLTLRVTPRVIEDAWLEMKIYQEQSNVTPSSSKMLDAGTIGSSVVTNKRSIKTTVNLKSGETVVLGGLIKEEQSDQVNMVPCLGGLTGIGELFKSTSRAKNKSNLMVFIRPVITNRFADLVHISREKYRASQELWGAADAKGSRWIDPLKPDPLPDFSPAAAAQAANAQTATAPSPTAGAEPSPPDVQVRDIRRQGPAGQRAEGGYLLQVFDSDQPKPAQLLARKLVARGYAAFVARTADPAGHPRHAVRVGYYAT
ncbi:MAG: type II secretion system secretin GspD, partial [Magnetococcales bacterium]|nr:type II secretion system secretin GspD [Magnetococcales bacterium]